MMSCRLEPSREPMNVGGPWLTKMIDLRPSFRPARRVVSAWSASRVTSARTLRRSPRCSCASSITLLIGKISPWRPSNVLMTSLQLLLRRG